MKKVTFEGVTFNADWAAGITEKQFVKHEAHTGLSAEQLKEAHSLCKAAVAAPAMEATQEPVADES
jgi:hypothetical protein